MTIPRPSSRLKESGKGGRKGHGRRGGEGRVLGRGEGMGGRGNGKGMAYCF